jgi:hypothetical protein
MLDAPIFTSSLDPDIAGDDPLGLAPVNERLYNAVFPGINNVVRYIRVYSSICWMVNLVDRYFQKHSSELNKGEAVRIANAAYEKVQLVLTWINKEKGHTQLAGTGRQFPNDDRKIRLAFNTFGLGSASLLEAVAYRPSLTTGLGFLERKPDGTYACTKAGLALANAFDAHARTSEKYIWLSDVTNMDAKRSTVFSLESIFDVSKPTKAEQDAFISQFFPSSGLEQYDQLSRNRWFSIHLTLRAVQSVCLANQASGEGLFATDQEIRACMASGRAKSGKVLDCHGVETVQVWWSVLQLRQLHRLALDVLFSATEQWLANNDLEVKSVSLDDCTSAIGKSALPGLNDEYLREVSSLQDFFGEGQGAHPTLYVAAANSAEENDSTNLFQYVDELKNAAINFNEDGGNDAVTSAYVALIFCAKEVQNLMSSPKSKDALLRDQDQCSLLSLAKLADKMKRASPQEFVSYLIRHWIVLRHFQIVCERSQNADGKNRFRFVLGDNGLERFNPAVRVTEPAFAQDKLRHILLLCHQCGLLHEKDGGYKLTPLGRLRLSGLTS